jgi:hypothetical protein
MKIYVHLGPTTKPHVAGPKRQILLTRSQARPRADWVSTSFHKDIKQFEGTRVRCRFRSLQNGALPGLVAWLLRKQAGLVEPLSRQVSDQLGELIAQGEAQRKATWLWSLLGGDPRSFFFQDKGVWCACPTMEKTEVVTIDHEMVPSTGDPGIQRGTVVTDSAELKEIADSLLPVTLSIEVHYKPKEFVTKVWKRFDPNRDKLGPEQQFKITVTNTDGRPRNIAVAGLTSKGETVGFWPWMPTAPRGWHSPEEINRIIQEERNPKVQVSLPDMWNKDKKRWQISSEGGAVHCLVVMLYHLQNPQDTQAHAATLKRLVESIQAIRIDRLLRTEFTKTRSFIVTPVADGGIWRQLEKLSGKVKEHLAKSKDTPIEFAEILILTTEAR